MPTASEAFLSRLCGKVFLSLWSYPNLYRDQGKRCGGDGKELCDLLVVFGDDVLVFSDKHCAMKPGPKVELAWSRWYRAAILESAKQLSGAVRWITDHPSRIFTDKTCVERLPIDLPTKPRIHRIATCRGTAALSRARHGGTGSLFVSNAALSECESTPLRVGCFDESGHMVHVFDEVAIELALETLDTVADFVRYLNRREALFRRGTKIVAAGEENLVAAYLRGVDANDEHDFELETAKKDSVYIDDSFWSWWANSKQRIARIEANRVSYEWDGLIQKFAHHMKAGTEHFPSPGVRVQETVARWMAREDRFSRRMLATTLTEPMATTADGQLRRRYLPPRRAGDPAWVFLIIPRPVDVDYEQYRETRLDMLLAHCHVVKHLNPEVLDVAGIAVETKEEEMSEDCVHLDMRNWSSEDDAQAKELRERRGIFKNPAKLPSKDWEFPISVADASRRQQERLEKKHRKMQRRNSKASRRANRD